MPHTGSVAFAVRLCPQTHFLKAFLKFILTLWSKLSLLQSLSLFVGYRPLKILWLIDLTGQYAHIMAAPNISNTYLYCILLEELATGSSFYDNWRL